MPVWKISSIEDRPQVTLEEWAVFEVPLNGPDQPLTRHLAGRSCEDCQGQVSSPVLAFDPNSGAFRTRSGRVYRLVGLPGLCADGSYVLNRWLVLHGFDKVRDVTGQVFEAIYDAQTARGVH
jgi:hypothetical protein